MEFPGEQETRREKRDGQWPECEIVYSFLIRTIVFIQGIVEEPFAGAVIRSPLRTECRSLLRLSQGGICRYDGNQPSSAVRSNHDRTWARDHISYGYDLSCRICSPQARRVGRLWLGRTDWFDRRGMAHIPRLPTSGSLFHSSRLDLLHSARRRCCPRNPWAFPVT